MRWAGGEKSISQVLFSSALGIRRMVLTAVEAWFCNSAVEGRRRRALRGVKRLAGGGRGDSERGVLCEIATLVVEACCRFEPSDGAREAAEDQEAERESVSAMLSAACSSGLVFGVIGIADVATGLVSGVMGIVDVAFIGLVLGVIGIAGVVSLVGLGVSSDVSKSFPIFATGVMGVPCPLPAIAAVEFLSQTATVGVSIYSELCSSLYARARGTFSCGNGYVLLGDIGGEGGAIGECQDSVLWNESDESAGEPGTECSGAFSTTPFVAEEDVWSFKDGAVAGRRDAKVLNRVRLTRNSPGPSRALPSLVLGYSIITFSGDTFSTSDGVCFSTVSVRAIVSGPVSCIATLLPLGWVTAGSATSTDFAWYISGLFDPGDTGADSSVVAGSRSFSIACAVVGNGALKNAFGSCGSSAFDVVVAVICGKVSLVFSATSGGIAVRGIADSGSSARGLETISDTRLSRGLVGVPPCFTSELPSALASILSSASGFVSGVAGVRLMFDVSNPKSEYRRTTEEV